MSNEAEVPPTAGEAAPEKPREPRCPLDGKRMKFHDLRTEAWPVRKGSWLCACGGIVYEEWWDTILALKEAHDAQPTRRGEE